MSIGEKMEADDIDRALARLFAGREPSVAALERCATMEKWMLRVHWRSADRRQITIEGESVSDRSRVKRQPAGPVRVLWMDRKRRWALTSSGLFALGAESGEPEKEEDT